MLCYEFWSLPGSLLTLQCNDSGDPITRIQTLCDDDKKLANAIFSIYFNLGVPAHALKKNIVDCIIFALEPVHSEK